MSTEEFNRTMSRMVSRGKALATTGKSGSGFRDNGLRGSTINTGREYRREENGLSIRYSKGENHHYSGSRISFEYLMITFRGLTVLQWNYREGTREFYSRDGRWINEIDRLYQLLMQGRGMHNC